MIRVSKGDLAVTPVECLLRPSRSDGASVTSVGRRVEALAGPRLEERVEAQGESPLGTAFLTPGGDLHADFVIHVVVQSVEEPVSSLTVQRGLVNALRRAADFGIVSVALPPLGGGAGNLHLEDTARAIVEVLRNHLAEGQPPREVHIVVESDYEESVFRSLVAEAAAGRSHS